ncbi:peptide ABC transporter substrate-binding protein [Loigolactobacillus jiayinensis]|uniref:Peptide ABC transporter substrate-binding protein n=1 Tax=Loigolactobacillus jiayinensis TaxID=2486016 RepID=A0ABW1RF25_9LACO|nr:peptide ABC transporter substrate-binding protein [Loigolactobacillus jiayinensis]
MYKRILALSIAATLLAVTLPFRSVAAKSEVFHSTSNAPIESLDSTKYSLAVSTEAIKAYSEGLYTYDQNNKVTPGMVKGQPQVNQAKTVYTFTLRNAKWSNGTAVTADDFVYAWQRLANPKTASTNAFRIDFIKNGEAVRLGKKPVTDLGVKAVNDHTLQVTLAQPIPFLKQYLTGAPFMPINRKYAEAQGAKYGTSAKHVLANGPFIVKGWTGTNDTWEYVRNPTYWDAKSVKLSKATVQVVKESATAANLFDSKQIDYAVLGDNNLQRYTGKQVLHKETTPTMGYVSINNKRSVTKNRHLRLALAQAFNKNSLTKNILKDGSVALNGLIPTSFAQSSAGKDYRKSTGQLLPYSPAKAKVNWKLAEKELNKKKVTLELLVADTPQAKTVGEFLQSQIEKHLPGVTITLKSVPVAQRIQAERDGKYDLAFGTWAPDYADPIDFLALYQSSSQINFSKYDNTSYDKKLTAITETLATEPTARWQKMQQAEKQLIQQDAALAPVYQAGVSYLQRSSIHGLQLSKFGSIVDYKYVTVK